MNLDLSAAPINRHTRGKWLIDETTQGMTSGTLGEHRRSVSGFAVQQAGVSARSWVTREPPATRHAAGSMPPLRGSVDTRTWHCQRHFRRNLSAGNNGA